MSFKLRLNIRLILSTFLVLALFFSSRVTAQAPNIIQETDAAITEGSNVQSWLDSAADAHGYIFLKSFTGKLPQELISGETKGMPIVWIPGGVFGTANTVIASLYQPPASGVEYIASTWNSFLGKPAYAQNGNGFNGLQPILPLWRTFRNVVYILSSFFFIIIGIMVMLRVKVSPQAVITLQNAIPQVITSLILVTFSYAIAGLLIDLSGLIQGLVISVLFQAEGKSLTGNLIGPQIFANIPVVNDILNWFNFGHISQAGILSIPLLFMIPTFVIVLFSMTISFILSFIISLPLTAVGGPAAIPVVTGLGTGLGGILVALVLVILIAIWLIKFIMGLFKAYTTVLFKIIFAPLEIGLGALPNSKIGFSSWLTETIAYLAVFPVSYLFLVISNLMIVKIIFGGITGTFASIISGTTSGAGLWTPNMLGGDLAKLGPFNIFGGIASAAISLSTLLILSKLPDLIPQAIFAMKPSPWGNAIGEGIGGIAAAPGNIWAGAGNVAKSGSQIHNFYKTIRGDRNAPNQVDDENNRGGGGGGRGGGRNNYNPPAGAGGGNNNDPTPPIN